MKKIVKISLLISIILMIYNCICFAATGSVTTDGVRVRKEASKEAEVITILNKSAKVEIIEKLEEWYKVKYQDYEGYMFAEYIKPDEEASESEVEALPEVKQEETAEELKSEEEQPTEGINTQPEEIYPKEVKTVLDLKVYIVPSITATITGNIEKEKTITIKEKLNDWSYVQLDNIIGWVRNYYLENAQVVQNTEQQEEKESKETVELDFTTGYVNVDSANVREEPSLDAKIVTSLILNNQVKIVSKTEEWYKIEYKDYKGYIAQRLISQKATETTSRSQTETRQATQTNTNNQEEKTAYVKVGVANIREAATTSSKILTTVKQKSEIKIVGEEAEFYKLNINNSTGYISKNLVVDSLEEIENIIASNQKPAVTISNDGTCDGTKIVEFAKQYLGYPYVWAGTTPSGFDCSGFVYYVFNSCGCKLSRSCSVQAQTGVAVDRENLQPGDIIFFNHTSSDGSISHVGIYIGDGNFIHASNPTRGVVIDTITKGTYSTHIHSIRRVL